MSASHRQIPGVNAERTRSHNRQMVLGSVRAAGAIGRAEIARASGLSTQAVSNIIADMLADGMLREHGRRTGGRGLPVQQYAINPSGGYGLGIEIRPNAVFSALIDLTGTTKHSHRTDLTNNEPKTVLAEVAAHKFRALNDTGVRKTSVLGAGVVMPGPFGATGIQNSGSDLPGWQDIDPQGLLEGALHLPVFVENDANASAMAERISGVAQGLETFAFLYFGQGLGLGLLQGGRLVSGAFGNAGEIGHIPVIAQGVPVALESCVSRLSVQAHLSAHGIDARDMDDLSRLYAQSAPPLLEWLDTAVQPFSAAIGIIENLFDPQVVILGGAMPDAVLDHLIDAVRLPDRSVSNRADRRQPRLMRGTSGRMTATLGAAALVLNQAFTPMIAASR